MFFIFTVACISHKQQSKETKYNSTSNLSLKASLKNDSIFLTIINNTNTKYEINDFNCFFYNHPIIVDFKGNKIPLGFIKPNECNLTTILNSNEKVTKYFGYTKWIFESFKYNNIDFIYFEFNDEINKFKIISDTLAIKNKIYKQ